VSARAVADFDRLAGVYATLERLTFGPALSRRRFCFLPEPRLASARRALVLGDGDGRFTAALLARHPGLEVTVVDASRKMLARLEARVRARTPMAALDLQCTDACAWLPSRAGYDVVAAHFFFDCFSTSDVEAILAHVTPALSPNAFFVVSEFAIPPRGLARPLARLLIRALYLAFRLLTGLEVTQLPDYAAALARAGFVERSVVTGLGGVLRSELWARSGSAV
jgi:SAM-dependent methyltransferase